MHGKGLAILLSKGPSNQGPEEDDGEESQEEEGNEVADSLEFKEMFDAFTDALGIKPKDPEAARRRFCALHYIHDAASREEY